jgi:hypothetical protein
MNSTCASFVLAALLLGGCVSTSNSTSTAGKTSGPWLVASPQLQAQIDDNAKRIPWTHGVEHVQMIQWFAGVGEPAYSRLLEMVKDPRTDVAGAAYAALGATRDSRLVEHIHAIPPPTGEGSVDLGYERARALLRLGDYEVMPALITGLRDTRPMTRALCSQALIEATRETFDYDPKAEEAVREESVKRWEAWWKTRQVDPLLTTPKAPEPALPPKPPSE